MSLTYTFYLLLFLPLLVFALWVSKKKVLNDEPAYAEYAIVTLIILTAWGEMAIFLKQWYFPLGVNLGIYIGNHPLETIIQGIITPLFIISFWEFIKRRH